MAMGQAQVSSGLSLFSETVLHKLMANNWDMRCLRTNATLPHDAWIAIDKTMVEVAQRRLIGVADLQGRGLTRELGGLGVLYDIWQKQSSPSVAEQSMSGITSGANNTFDYTEVMVPIPITHIDFSIDARKLSAMQLYGTPIDTTQVSDAATKVVDKIEDMLFNGSTVVAGGHSILGYTNYTHSNEVACTGNWTGTVANIELDVRKLIAANEADLHFGPYILYVAKKEWNDLRARDSTAGGITYLEILKSLAGIADVKVTGVLAAGYIALVEMASETIDMSVGVDIMTVEWPTHGGMQSNFKVFAAMAPRVKSDYLNQCGVAYDTNLGQS